MKYLFLLPLLTLSGATRLPVTPNQSAVAQEQAMENRLADSVQVAAHLMTSVLEVGQTYEILVELTLAEGMSASDAGIPAPLLQIDVPPSIELEGRELTTYKELAANEFLQVPFERVLEQLPGRVAFKLIATPGENETIGLNLTGYVSSKDGRMGFLRRRLELPLVGGASALEVDSRNSNWGNDPNVLQIGDLAPDFSLPRADGSELALSHYVGEKNILLTTYRAHW